MIHALPGMGADARMYDAPAWRKLPGFAAHGWSACSQAQTLAEAARITVETAGIRDGDCLVGTSLGGMVACEITRLRRIPRLFLIGSALHPGEINSLLSVLRPFREILPIESIRFSSGKLPGELAGMFAKADPAFVRTMLAAVFSWHGGSAPETQVFRLHGAFDLVIPPPPRPDLLLSGGHLITMTHAAECAAFVAEKTAAS